MALLKTFAYVITLLALTSTASARLEKCTRRSKVNNNANALHRDFHKSSSNETKASEEWTAPSVVGTKESAWVPVDGKVRGVSLGSWFVIEPWMLSDTWSKMGCDGYNSERSCNEALGLEKLQPLYEKHWNSFYSQEDFYEMKKLGLNTVRIPLPYWTVDSVIGDDEPFARGSMRYVKQAMKWAKNAGLYVVMDLHALPGRQIKDQSFTGDTTLAVSFFSSHNYGRAYDVLTNWTTLAHTDPDFSNVVMIEVVNEPEQGNQPTLIAEFYPQAQKVIRATEKSLGVTCGGSGKQCLTIQMMSSSWGSGDPTTHVDTSDRLAYDDHLYAQWIIPEWQRTRKGYLDFLCTTDRTTNMNGPIIVGEWSLSTIGGGELETSSAGALEFFQRYAAAQIYAAERGAGWFFWSWKTQLQDNATWDYQGAVKAGYIPKDLSKVDTSVCSGY